MLLLLLSTKKPNYEQVGFLNSGINLYLVGLLSGLAAGFVIFEASTF